MAMETPNEQLMSFQPSRTLGPRTPRRPKVAPQGEVTKAPGAVAAAKPLEWRVPLFSPNLLENYNHWKTIICFHHGFPIMTGLV